MFILQKKFGTKQVMFPRFYILLRPMFFFPGRSGCPAASQDAWELVIGRSIPRCVALVHARGVQHTAGIDFNHVPFPSSPNREQNDLSFCSLAVACSFFLHSFLPVVFFFFFFYFLENGGCGDGFHCFSSLPCPWWTNYRYLGKMRWDGPFRSISIPHFIILYSNVHAVFPII